MRMCHDYQQIATLVSSLNLDSNRDGFTVLERRFLALASILAGSIYCCCLFQQSKQSQCLFCFISAIKKPGQPFQTSCFWGFTSALNLFRTLTFTHYSISHHPSNLSTPDSISLVQLARFSISSGRNFYKHLLVLSNIVKWSKSQVTIKPFMHFMAFFIFSIHLFVLVQQYY